MKQNLTVLWLDDQRDPKTYFSKKDIKGEGTLHDNLMYYENLGKQYNIDFVWVKTYNEFVNYIKQNGIPQFISFDHDLSKTSSSSDPKGFDCAKWLVNYCKQNGIKMPMTYVHSANKKWAPVMKSILNGATDSEILENLIYEAFKETLLEGVYVNGVKGNKAYLTYKRGQNRNIGSLINTDNIKTDKMDENSEKTYEVPLKGGIMSYNITSINGTEVMHYFKKYFDREKSEIKLQGETGQKQSYELTMEQREFNEFLDRFIMKVQFVIYYYLQKNKKQNNSFKGISIFPVKSRSNFSTEMVKRIACKNIIGLPIIPISEELFVKDLRTLQKDTDFINKNKEFYNSPLSSVKGNTKPVETYLDTNIAKYQALQPAMEYIEKMTKLVDNIIIQLYNYRTALKNPQRDTRRMIVSMAQNYKEYYDYYLKCLAIKYKNSVTGKDGSIQLDTFAEQLSYSKDPQIEIRTEDVWKLIKPYLRGQKSTINGKPYEKLPLQRWVYKNFQIKNLSNGERMGLKGIYNVNTNTELVQEELNKIKGTVFVIFDDNISGGATLSDICYQAKNLGIEYIVPITFGKMVEKWSYGPAIPLNRPKNGFNYNQ